ncbi:MAG: DNA-directed RNA polymerase subunit omega [Rickettsiales bacterium]|jgi:DNA-directed RNA polymerase subunit omega|nr:DNA-directed RNA polymerase subunit omega [Rickettsiales bacterium]
MSRITISDDLPFVDSKYELGMLASQRVRDLNGGESPVIPLEAGDKPAVTALREIASGKLDIGTLRDEFIQSYKKLPTASEAEETLESNAAAPELKELDDELAGVAEKKEELSAEADEELAEESEGTNETPATGEQ